GETTKTITVVVADDAIVENDETFVVNLANARYDGAVDASRVVISDSQGQATIQNNDTAQVSINDVTALENGTFTFTVSLSTTADHAITVDYGTADGSATAGSDYTATS